MNNSYGLKKVVGIAAAICIVFHVGGTNAPAQGDTHVLKDIVFQETGDGFSVAIQTDGDIPEYIPSCLLYPSRFVVDLPGNWKNSGKSLYEVSNSVVEKIIVGEHADYLRIVMHLFGAKRLSPIIEESQTGMVVKVGKQLIEPIDGYVEPDLAGKRNVSDIEYNDTPAEFSVKLIADGPVTEFKSFFITNKSPSLIVDLAGFWDFPGEPEISVDSDIARTIRIGEHPDFFRIAIDLSIPEPVAPEFGELPDGLLITIRK